MGGRPPMQLSEYLQVGESMLAAVELAADRDGLDSGRDGSGSPLSSTIKRESSSTCKHQRRSCGWRASRAHTAFAMPICYLKWQDTRTGCLFQTLLQQAITEQGGPNLQLC